VATRSESIVTNGGAGGCRQQNTYRLQNYDNSRTTVTADCGIREVAEASCDIALIDKYAIGDIQRTSEVGLVGKEGEVDWWRKYDQKDVPLPACKDVETGNSDVAQSRRWSFDEEGVFVKNEADNDDMSNKNMRRGRGLAPGSQKDVISEETRFVVSAGHFTYSIKEITKALKNVIIHNFFYCVTICLLICVLT